MAELQLVGFKLSHEEYVVDIMKVKEIIKISEITKIPEAKSFVEGVINLRGNIIPVINLKVRLGLSYGDEEGIERKIIVIEQNGKWIGMIVDMVTEVIRLDSTKIDPTPELITNVDKKNIRGIGKFSEDRLLIILDIEKIIEETETA
ncbi:MAG: chemotaxis protein CheW [Candidatus Muirbacterium halophilum]|nr:chemotaxis protein CheW [Candidatus Muirbacterium halophilum]MCK9474941.1 chemotaxis protein CheW [Candidatus Muirbacterium halophilum]